MLFLADLIFASRTDQAAEGCSSQNFCSLKMWQAETPQHLRPAAWLTMLNCR